MKGVNYIVDDNGNPTAVVIDLQKHGEMWEDFQDILIARQRKDEPRVPLEEVKRKFQEKLGITNKP